MRKAVEKLINLAIEHGFTNEEIDILKREDLTIPILNIIYRYFLNNNKYYSSGELCEEVDRVLNLPFTGEKKNYIYKLRYVLPEYQKDSLIGSINKRIIMRLDKGKFASKNFYYIYEDLLSYKADYQLIRKIYRISKDIKNKSDISSLENYLCGLNNTSNINTILKIFIQCFNHKAEICDYHYMSIFSKLANVFIYADNYIDVNIDNDWINKYIINYNEKTNYALLFDTIYKYQNNSLITSLFNILNRDNITFTQGYSEAHKVNTYNFTTRWKDDSLINKFKELSDKTDTDTSIKSINSKLSVKIRGEEITIHLEEFGRVSLSKLNEDINIGYYSRRNNIMLWIPADGCIYKAIEQDGKIKKCFPLGVRDFINLLGYKYNDTFVQVLNVYKNYCIDKNIFFKDIFKDCDNSLSNNTVFIPLSLNECFNYHNRTELIHSKYKLSSAININWNKRNINLSYLIIKSYPYVNDKGKEILKQITNFDLSKVLKCNHYKKTVLSFLQVIIYDYINKNTKTKEAEIKKELGVLQTRTENDYDEYNEYLNKDLDIYIRDYLRMLLFNTKRYGRIKLNINSVEEIHNIHNIATFTIDYDKQTKAVNIPVDSVFNNLQKILPDDFEWIKSRKRLILETKIQHHCVWSYADKISEDKCAIYSYVDTDGSKSYDGISKRYTIEFSYNKEDGRYYVVQTQGRYDGINSSLMNGYVDNILNNYYDSAKSA